MEELKFKDLQMQALNEKITDTLSKLEKSKRVELDIADIQQKLREFQVAYDSAHLELRHIGEDPQKHEMKQMIRQHKARLKEIRNEFEWKRAEAVKEQLLGDHKTAQHDLTTADGLMQHGLDVQDSSTASLQRTRQVVIDTGDIGRDINTKLDGQREQLGRMYESLYDIESTLQRSTAIIRRIGRKMATDKYIWCIVFLVFAAIVFIIIWTEIQKRRGNDTSGIVNSPPCFNGCPTNPP